MRVYNLLGLIALLGMMAVVSLRCALSQPAPSTAPPELSRALGQMVSEAQQREAAALMRAYAAEAELRTLRAASPPPVAEPAPQRDERPQ